jgi:hypothetical protein
VVALVAIAALVVVLVGGHGSPGTPGGPSGSGLDREIDPSTISASASSEHTPIGDKTYGVENTLDGNIETAWNDGVAGPGIGATLTYRFPQPVRLVRIDLINGYASTATPGLFLENARIKDVTITTDAGSFHVTLADTRDSQSVRRSLGPTGAVTLRIDSVYAQTRFPDVALTEIAFLAA